MMTELAAQLLKEVEAVAPSLGLRKQHISAVCDIIEKHGYNRSSLGTLILSGEKGVSGKDVPDFISQVLKTDENNMHYFEEPSAGPPARTPFQRPKRPSKNARKLEAKMRLEEENARTLGEGPVDILNKHAPIWRVWDAAAKR